MKFSRSVLIGQVLAFSCLGFGIPRAFLTRELGLVMPGVTIGFWRFAIGSFLLVLFLRRRAWHKPSQQDWPWLILSASCLSILISIFPYILTHLHVSLALFISFMGPLWLTAAQWWRERRLSRLVLISVGLYLVGEMTLLMHEATFSQLHWKALAVAAFSSLTMAIFLSANRRLAKQTKLPSIFMAVYQQLLALLLVGSYLLILRQPLIPPARLTSWGELLILGLVTGAVFFPIQFAAQRRITTMEFAMWAAVEPLLVSYVVGGMIYHEGAGRFALIGMFLVTTGAITNVLTQQRQNVS